jgi:tetratricopeptide (TPR) repeat protein
MPLAAKYFGQAIEMDVRFVPAHIGLFRVHLLELTALPKPAATAAADVLAAAASLMTVAPSSAEAHMASSVRLFLSGQLESALAEVRLAARMPACSKQTRAITHSLAGSYLLELGQATEALWELKLSEEAVPTCAIGQVALGYPYFVEGRFDLALVQYQRSIELEPRQWLGWFWSARVHEEMHDYLRAIDHFEQADLRTLENDGLNAHDMKAAVEITNTSSAALRAVVHKAGEEGYWRARLEAALASTSRDARYLARVNAKLGWTDDAYAWLKTAAQ